MNPGALLSADADLHRPRRPLTVQDRVLSMRTGPAAKITERCQRLASGDPVLWTAAASGVAIDHAHQRIVRVGGEGRSRRQSAARQRALHEFVERLVLHEPSVPRSPSAVAGAGRAEPGECPLARHRLPTIDISSGQPGELPAEEFYLHPDHCPRSSREARPTSSGAAVATTYSGALERALLELLERDAVMTVWRFRLTMPRLRHDPELHRHVGELAGAECETSLVDLSSIHNVPTVLCVVRGFFAGVQVRTVGSAADRTARAAAVRAAREALSVRAVCLEWLANPEGPAAAGSSEGLAEHARYYLDPRHGAEADRLDSSPATSQPARELSGSAEQLVGAVAAALAARGSAVHAAELTPPWLARCGLRVVVTRSPDLYPLEVGFGSTALASRLVARSPFGPRSLAELDLSPVPLA